MSPLPRGRGRGLSLRWTDRIPYSRPALAAFARLHTTDSETAIRFAAVVFGAYFADGLDIEPDKLLVSPAEETGGDANGLRAASASAAANDALTRSEVLASRNGVVGTPTWIAGGRRISGLRPRQWSETGPPRSRAEPIPEAVHPPRRAEVRTLLRSGALG